MSWRCGTNLLLRSGIVLLGMCLGAGVQSSDTPAEMDSVPTRAGYSAGYAFGGQLARLQGQKPGVELEAVFRGILDALSGAEPRLSNTEMRAALQGIERNATAGMPEREKSPQKKTRARSGGYVDDFAVLNARREGVVTLASGVQYEVLKAGNGRQPGAGDAVLISYQASLTNGTVFDTTYEDGEPLRMELDEIVVPGLKEALLLMNEGAKWRVVIPPSMGFGRSGNNQLRRRDLIYELELVSIEGAQASER
jgi:FKBP-type peptidyl-prolyl cis-trans isomerase FklB